MKKLFSVVLLVLLAALVWYLVSSERNIPPSESSPAAAARSDQSAGAKVETPDAQGSKKLPSQIQARLADAEGGDEDADGATVKSAAELYKNAAEAFEAVQKGAVDYDDLVLEQFADPGEDCTWCPEFYKQIKDSLLSPETSQDQKSYYAEILAISGKVDNVSALIEAVQNAPNQEASEIFAEALEVTAGNDETVKFLGEQLDTGNQLLKESLVAAITNHGSRLAVDTLYKKTVEAGDPDGLYSLGIGLGEIIPEEEAIPALTELAGKKDAYSHLAVKALLNYGPEGLRIVNDILTNSSDPEINKQLLQNAEDHVNYDEQTEAMLKEIAASSKSPEMVSFAKAQLEQMKEEEMEDQEEDEDLVIEEEGEEK